MKIACDTFNHELFSTNKSFRYKYEIVDDFQTNNEKYDVIISSWHQIKYYLFSDEQKTKSSLLIVSQYSDASNNRGVSDLIDQYNTKHNAMNKFVIIGDGVSNYSCNIHSPWSRFIWAYREFLFVPAEKRTHWTCLMSRYRPHRDLIAEYLDHNKDLFDLPNDFVYDGTQLKNLHQFMCRDIIPLPTSYKDVLKYNRNFPQWIRSGKGKNIDVDSDLIPAYHRSKIELVAETATDIFFITEKTIKPIRSCMPFVMVGCKHFMRKLRQMGFKTFEPWIDESYDSESDMETRVKMACKAFKDFVLSDRYSDYKLIMTCYHNQLHLKKISKRYSIWERKQIKKIEYFINQYAKTYQ